MNISPEEAGQAAEKDAGSTPTVATHEDQATSLQQDEQQRQESMVDEEEAIMDNEGDWARRASRKSLEDYLWTSSRTWMAFASTFNLIYCTHVGVFERFVAEIN